MRPNNQNQNKNRGRNRGPNNRRGGGNSHRSTYDSNGPNVRIRGSASQIHDKYITLARDASSSGDPVLAESYLQYAEHYYRIANPEQENRPPRRHEQASEGAEEGAASEISEQEAQPADRGRGRGRGRGRFENTEQVADVGNDAPIDDANDEGEAVVETISAPPSAPMAEEDDEAPAAPRRKSRVKTFEQGDLLSKEESAEMSEPPAKPRRRRTTRAKAPQSPAELAAAVSGED